jgi:prophage antirepressor-like protein
MKEENKYQALAIFKGKAIRRTIHRDEWWFVVNDVIEVLTDSTDPAQYFKRMKVRDQELALLIDKGGVQFVPPLMLEVMTAGGAQKMYCWNTEGIFRLIQSIPSPGAGDQAHPLALQTQGLSGRLDREADAGHRDPRGIDR